MTEKVQRVRAAKFEPSTIDATATTLEAVAAETTSYAEGVAASAQDFATEATGTLRDTNAKVAEFVESTQAAVADAAQDLTATVQSAVTTAVQGTAQSVETLIQDTQKNMTEQFEKITKSLEGVTSFGQQNVDALVKTSEIAAKAAEGISSEISAYSKKALEDGVAAAQDFASAKTMTELFEKQTAFAQVAFEGWMHQATKMNEIYTAAAKDITAPFGQRVTAATEKLKTFAL